MLLDTSNSIRERLHFEKDASIDFLDNVIRRHKDQAFLMTFDNEPEVIQDFTGDVGTLTQAIEKQRAGGGTSLNDAIYVAAQKLVSAPMPDGPNPEVRRVLVVFSDGEDNLSDRALSESIEMAERCEVSIYSISTSTDWVAVTSSDQPSQNVQDPWRRNPPKICRTNRRPRISSPTKWTTWPNHSRTSAPSFAANISSPTRPRSRPTGNTEK